MTTAAANRELFTVGDLIAKARRDAHMNQDKLATAIGRARKTISRWETGLGEPRTKDLRKIATVTDASWLIRDLSDLLGREKSWLSVTADQIRQAA